MLRSAVKTTGRLALVLALCAGTALAQRGGRGGMSGMGGRPAAGAPSKEDAVNLFDALLGLDDSQKKQLSTVLDGAIQTAGPIQEQLDKGKQSLFEAAKAGKSEAEINKIADQQGPLYAQMLALGARSFAKVCGLLTGEQQAKVDSFLYQRLESLLSGSTRASAGR
jgi:hypothetical protein